MNVLPSVHKTAETAYVIKDYPFGFKLRCMKRMWIETKKGQQRVVYQTTTKDFNRNPEGEPTWNKPKYSTYDAIKIFILEDERITVTELSTYAWISEINEFKGKYSEFLDDPQLKRLEQLC